MLCASRSNIEVTNKLRKGAADENMFYHIGYFECENNDPLNPDTHDKRIFYSNYATGIYITSKYSTN